MIHVSQLYHPPLSPGSRPQQWSKSQHSGSRSTEQAIQILDYLLIFECSSYPLFVIHLLLHFLLLGVALWEANHSHLELLVMRQLPPQSQVHCQCNLLDEVAMGISGLQLHLNHSQRPPLLVSMGISFSLSLLELRNVEDGDALVVDNLQVLEGAVALLRVFDGAYQPQHFFLQLLIIHLIEHQIAYVYPSSTPSKIGLFAACAAGGI